jgi:hypothetical protein
MTVQQVLIPTKVLTESLPDFGMTFKVNNIRGYNKENLTAADLPSRAFGQFRNANNTVAELFEYDPSTIANDRITILNRGLAINDPETSVPANIQDWALGSTYVELDVSNLVGAFPSGPFWRIGGGSGSKLTVSAIEPTSPVDGDLWVDIS